MSNTRAPHVKLYHSAHGNTKLLRRPLAARERPNPPTPDAARGSMYGQSNETVPGRVGVRQNADIPGDHCMASAFTTLKRAREIHQVPDAHEVARVVRAHLNSSNERYNKVVAVIFWGRRRYTSLLRPYLMRELAVNGGVVDEIMLCVNTEDTLDVAASNHWVRSAANLVRSVSVTGKKGPGGLPIDGLQYCIETVMQGQPQTVFIKIDDDIVRIEEGSLSHLVSHLIFHPSATFRRHGLVSANVVNHGHLATVHAALGAWSFNEGEEYDFFKYSAQHPTSLVTSGERQHQAYLSHVKEKTTDVYRFRAFDMNQCSCVGQINPRAMNRCTGGVYYRWGINLIAFGGEYIDKQKLPNDNDEWWLTAGWREWLGEHAEVVGDAIAVHFAYSRQRNGGIGRSGFMIGLERGVPPSSRRQHHPPNLIIGRCRKQ
jgi:hypothetical protein